MNEKESKLLISGPVGSLEVAINVGHSDAKFSEQSAWVIICHPHPQHGGTMDNKVVTTLMRTYRDLGISVVRFNFRGVGLSQGSFGQGEGEFDDLISVIDWLIQTYSPKALWLAGFSFGSAIAARASYKVTTQYPQLLKHLVLVAPPLERYTYDQARKFPVGLCVVQGDLDERVNASGVYSWCAQLESPVVLLRYAEATHFFHGFLTQMKTDLTQQVEQSLSVHSQ